MLGIFFELSNPGSRPCRGSSAGICLILAFFASSEPAGQLAGLAPCSCSGVVLLIVEIKVVSPRPSTHRSGGVIANAACCSARYML